jgi:hypothetical protein
MANFALALEMLGSLFAIFYFPEIKQRFGMRAAVAGAVAGATVIASSRWETIRDIYRAWSDSSFARALSLLSLTAFLFLLIKLLFEEAAELLTVHARLYYLTPPLIAFAYWITAGYWKLIGFCFWLLVPAMWVRELAAEPGVVRFFLGRNVYVLNNCALPLDVHLAPSNLIGFAGQDYSWHFDVGEGRKRLTVADGSYFRSHSFLYGKATSGTSSWNGNYGSLGYRKFSPDDDGTYTLNFCRSQP